MYDRGELGKHLFFRLVFSYPRYDNGQMDRQEQITRLARQQGWSAEAVSMWRKRGKVPHSARYKLARAAEEVGISINPSDFEGWRTTRGPRAGIAA
jgi:hypothetical protein